MSDSKIYSGYISYYIKNIGQGFSNKEWREILIKNLGSNTSKTSFGKWKELALKLYYTHYVSLSFKVDSEKLIETKKSGELRDILIASNEFREKYDIGELSVVHHTSDTEAIKHMKHFHAPDSVIDDIMSQKSIKGVKGASTKGKKEKKETKPKKAESTTKATSTVKSGNKTDKSGKIITKPVAKVTKTTIPAFLVVKQGRKTVTLTKREDIIKHIKGGVSPVKTTAKPAKSVKTSKTCDNYTLVELREIAKEKNLAGRSTMNKATLCKALGIK